MDTSTTQSCIFHKLTQENKKRKLSRQYQHIILMTKHYTLTQFLPREKIKVTGAGIPCCRTAEKPQRLFLYSWQGLKDSAYWLWHSQYMCTHKHRQQTQPFCAVVSKQCLHKPRKPSAPVPQGTLRQTIKVCLNVFLASHTSVLLSILLEFTPDL